jgi:hypothetical protein
MTSLFDQGRHEQADKLLPQLPGLLQAQDWSDSAYYLLRRWKAVATKLNNAKRPAECVHIVQHILQVMDAGHMMKKPMVISAVMSIQSGPLRFRP